METTLIILLGAMLLLLIVIIVLFFIRKSDPAINMMQQEVLSLRGQMTDAMFKNQSSLNQQLGQITAPDANGNVGRVLDFLKAPSHNWSSSALVCLRTFGVAESAKRPDELCSSGRHPTTDMPCTQLDHAWGSRQMDT